MIILIILTAVLVIVGLFGLVFFGGVAVGVSNNSATRERMTSARLRALEAERRLHDLTRETFIRISEAAERRSNSR